MTNYYENLDSILSQYRFKFLNSYEHGDYIAATAFLYAMNCAHPPAAKLEDMHAFRVGGNTLTSLTNKTERAKVYCDKWLPLLEEAMARFRQTNQEAYNAI